MSEMLEREAELGRLGTALDAAAGGRGRVVFVGGEAGVGKTTLVEAFAASLEERLRVAFGRSDALGTPRALGPFVDIAAVLDVEPTDDRDVLLGRLVADVRDGPPTVLVIEDAHWADDASIDLVAMLGRRAVDLPLLLIVTYREEEVVAGHPLRQALGNLATASGAVWIGIGALSLEAVRVLAEPTGADAGAVYALTGGNAFYVTETLAAPAGSVATSVRLAVLARASRLSPGARRLLDAVAIVPGRAERWLAEALCDPSADDVHECLAAGVLLSERGELVFRHELARRAIEEEIAEGRRRELHRSAAVALAGPSADPARVAHHAERAGDDALLATSAADACRLAVARGANAEAARLGEQALAVADELTDDDVADLKVQLARALNPLGRGDDAIALAGDAVEHWRSAGDARREAAALTELTASLVGRGRTVDAMAAADHAARLLVRLPPSVDLARAYASLTGLHMLARDRDTAVEWGRRAVELATRLDDMATLGWALIQSGIADVMDGRFEGLDGVRRGIELGREHDVAWVAALGLSQIGSGCGELRRYDLAVPALVEGIDGASEHHLEGNRLYMTSWLARCRFDLGQWDEAEDLAHEVLAGSRGTAIARFVALNTLGWLRARRGDDDVWPLLDEALEIARRTGHLQRLWPCAVARAEAGWLDGDLEPHVGLLGEMVELAGRYRHHVAVGELGVSLGRAGRGVASPGAEPFAAWNRGDLLAAVSGFRSLGCPYEAASALACTDDTRSLREALATFERLGAVPAAERVAAELRARGVTAKVRADRDKVAAANPAGLTDREVEVVQLVAAGFTNPQIAASLYISRKTAEHHVSNILTKLGATTRAEAAASAVRLAIAAR